MKPLTQRRTKLQIPDVFKALPRRQNLHIALQDHLDHRMISEKRDRLPKIPGLSSDASPAAGLLSHGQQQWLEIGTAPALRHVRPDMFPA